MKNTIKFLVVIALAILSVNASAIPIGDVGPKDKKIGKITTRGLNNRGFKNVKAWVEKRLKTEIAFSSGSGHWEKVTNRGKIKGYAYNFGSSSPVHFLVKKGNKYRLYKNVGNSQWGFIQKKYGKPNIRVIRHVGPPTGSVPAPGPLAVMAIGLAGILGLSRFKKVS